MVSRVNNEAAAPGVADLAGGILDDVQTLVAQEAKLLRAEVEEEWEKAKTAAVTLVVGAVFATLAGILLTFTAVYLLHDNVVVNGQPLSLSKCFAVVTVVLAIVGGALLIFGRKQAAEVNVVPEQTVESIAEVTGNG